MDVKVWNDNLHNCKYLNIARQGFTAISFLEKKKKKKKKK